MLRKRINIFRYLIIILLFCTSWVSAESEINERTDRFQPRVIPVKSTEVSISDNAQAARVIVKFNDDLAVRFRSDKLISNYGAPLQEAQSILEKYQGSSLRRLFVNQTEDNLDFAKELFQYKSKTELADLNSYYAIEINSVIEAETVVNQLNALSSVEIAYMEPVAIPAEDISPPTPDYIASQLYLNAAPNGIDADYAKTLAGGDGSGITIVDIEGNWQTTHEDLDKAASGFVVGEVVNSQTWLDHGTAVIGVMIGSDNGYGVTGISPGADLGMISAGSMSVAEAIYTAIDSLDEGDIILIELQAPGPHYDFAIDINQEGYIAMEYWQANFDAMKYAWAKGITVIEAAGNGCENYDDIGIYGELFDSTYRNSHALLIGAGFPATSETDLERESYSNYGERVNLQGYGSGVYTTGYGDLFDGNGDMNQYYTSDFGGTSSASPIIAGAAACIQGYMKSTFGTVLSPDYIRDILTSTGTAQLGDTSEHIGPRPNLFAAINAISAPPSLSAEPIYIDTSLAEGESITLDLWLKNSSTTDNINYYIYDRDTTAKVLSNWLEVSSQAGIVYANDSALIDVILDGSLLSQRSADYIGLLEIIWGHGAASLDSFLLVPVYLNIPCTDSSFSALSSNEMNGPVYSWISAKDSGVKIDNALYYNNSSSFPLINGTAGPFGLGFSFPFFTNYYDSFYVGVNGAISFTEIDINVNGKYSELSIPGLPFTSFIAPLWFDLVIDDINVPDAGVYVYQSVSLDTIVIEWYRLSNYNQSGDTLTNFEVILSDDGNVLFQYKSVGLSGIEQLALVGLSEIDCKSFNYGESRDTSLYVSDNEAVQLTNHLYFGQTGNINGIESIDIADLVYLVEYMFASGPPPVPIGAADVDCTTEVDIGDLVYLVAYMFSSGDEPCEQWLHDGGN